MAKSKGKDTAPEALVSECLKALGIKHKKRVKRLPGTPDIVIDGVPIAVFVHGCVWHQHVECGAGEALIAGGGEMALGIRENPKRDLRVKKELEDMGWTVVTLWECHIHKSPTYEAMKVKRTLDSLADT